MKFAVVDIEGTGGKAGRSRIMEIAVIIFDGHQVTDTFSTLVNPEKPVDGYVRKMTGIGPKMLRRAPKFHEVAKRLAKMFRNTIFTAHNANFDYRMLQLEFARLGYDFSMPVLDTVTYAEKLLDNVPSYGLDALTKSLRIPVHDRHRALGDARATLEILKILLEKDPAGKTLSAIIRQPQEFPEFTNDLSRKIYYLPDAPGLLKLYDRHGNLLYVAYSNNIRQKAEKKLAGKSSKARELHFLTDKIRYEKVDSPLLGKIKQSLYRQKFKPVFSKPAKFTAPGTLPVQNALLTEKKTGNGKNIHYLVRDGKVKGYALTDLHWQHADLKSLENRISSLENCPAAIHYLSGALEKNRLEITPLNSENETGGD